MKTRFSGILAGQIIMLVIVCAISSFIALTTFGAVGGVSIAAAPEFTFKLFAPLLCDEGTEMQYRQERYSYHRPGESTPFVECVAPDGTVLKDVTGTAIAISLAGSYLACFLPLFVPGAILALIIPPILLRRKNKTPGVID